jgi:nicotinamide-nucleotide amidase
MLGAFEVQVRERVGKYVYGVDEETPAASVGKLLRDRNLTIATMESCTGGLLANMLTDNPGSSNYFKAGMVAYTAEAKIGFGVDPQVIERVGTVDAATAEAIARAARERAGADIGLSTTGVAGPDPLEGKPVGALYLGLDIAGKRKSEGRQIVTTRAEFKRRAAMDALFLLWRSLHEG